MRDQKKTWMRDTYTPIFIQFLYMSIQLLELFFNTAFQDTATIQSNLMLTWNVSNA